LPRVAGPLDVRSIRIEMQSSGEFFTHG
jgi:hypothetical protein